MNIIPVPATPTAKVGVYPCCKSVSLNQQSVVRFVSSDDQANISMVLKVKKVKKRLIIDRWIRTEYKIIRKREIVDL